MTDLSVFDDRAIKAALNGDFSLLAQRLRNGAVLRQDERAFLADRLEGKPLKRGPKSKVTENDMRAYLVVNWLIRIDGDKPYIATTRAAEIFNTTEKTIRDRVKRYESNPWGVTPELEIKLAEWEPEMRERLMPDELR